MRDNVHNCIARALDRLGSKAYRRREDGLMDIMNDILYGTIGTLDEARVRSQAIDEEYNATLDAITEARTKLL